MNKLAQKLDTVGVLLLIGAAVYYAVNNIFDKWVIGLALLGGVSVVVGVVANYKQIMQTLGRRSTKYFTNYVVSVVLVLGLVAGLNFFGQRHTKRFDLTAAGRFTLAPQTVQILSKLNNDLDIKVFFPGGDYAPMKELLTQYRADLLWFDEIDMKSDAQVEDLYQAIRKLRPECIVNSRIQDCRFPAQIPPPHCDYITSGDNEILDKAPGFE